ncbi:conserved Plasmodium protein, unknown function, partial [Plasmodium malariae]
MQKCGKDYIHIKVEAHLNRYIASIVLMMNILKNVKLGKAFFNTLNVMKKNNFSTKEKNYEIFENENFLIKFQELKMNKIIYKKDYNEYLKLYKMYNPNYVKLTTEKNNSFKFSICWIINDKTVHVNNEETKKIKAFTVTLCNLKEKLSKLGENLNQAEDDFVITAEGGKESEHGKSLSNIVSKSGQDDIGKGEKNANYVNITGNVNNRNGVHGTNVAQKKEGKRINLCKRVNHKYRGHTVDTLEEKTYTEVDSNCGHIPPRINYSNFEIHVNKSVIMKEEEKKETRINYVKMAKLWELFLFHKENNNVKEEKVYFEILKKLFLKASFFEKNKKKDFQFFENILTSSLLKPDIFISVLNLLYSIFFNSSLNTNNDIMKNGNQVKGSCNSSNHPIVSSTVNGAKINSCSCLVDGNSIVNRKDVYTYRDPAITNVHFKQNNIVVSAKRKNINDTIKLTHISDSQHEYKNRSTENLLLNYDMISKIRRYILKYLFNTFYEKHLGLKSLHDTFDMHYSYKLKYCSRENNLFKFVSLNGVEAEAKNVLLIRCTSKRSAGGTNYTGSTRCTRCDISPGSCSINEGTCSCRCDGSTKDTFFLGLVKKAQRINDLYVLHLDVKKYKLSKCNKDIMLYEEMNMNEDYYECYLNSRSKNCTKILNEYAQKKQYASCSWVNSTPCTDNNSSSNCNNNSNNVYEAVTLTVQLNTISNRIKYSMLNLFDKKEFLNKEIIQVLLNEENGHISKGELKINKFNKILTSVGDYNYLIEEAINKFLQHRKKEINYFNVSDNDLIKKDQIINILYKKLKNDQNEFTKLCNIYKKFDIYQKSVLYDILVNEKL